MYKLGHQCNWVCNHPWHTRLHTPCRLLCNQEIIQSPTWGLMIPQVGAAKVNELIPAFPAWPPSSIVKHILHLVFVPLVYLRNFGDDLIIPTSYWLSFHMNQENQLMVLELKIQLSPLFTTGLLFWSALQEPPVCHFSNWAKNKSAQFTFQDCFRFIPDKTQHQLPQ